uniref:DUF6598 domain-containing protein n=1 Tax=Oryza barthii TaxID=65489 RepID=A0A0D3G212_9ORYZ
MEEKLRQVKLEMKGKYSYTDELGGADAPLPYIFGFLFVSPLRSLPTHNVCARHAIYTWAYRKICSLRPIKKGLEWPLHVYGLVAVRDSVDHNRNLLFHRTRDDCQILTQKDSFLELTGPSRAIMLGWYSKFKFTYAVLNGAVEATICRVKVVRGSWTKENRGRIVCRTSGIGHEDFVLLASQDAETMPIGSDDDVIKLSRRVVTVELSGQLTVCVAATQAAGKTSTREDDGGIAQNEAPSTMDEVRFRPQKSGESCAISSVPAMRCTHGSVPGYSGCDNTMQILPIEVVLLTVSCAILPIDLVDFEVQLKFTLAMLEAAVEARPLSAESKLSEDHGQKKIIDEFTACIGDEDIVLLDSRGAETKPIGPDDELSRRVVCVEYR